MNKTIIVLAVISAGVIGVSQSEPPQSAQQNPVRLVLPPAVYAVPGNEINVYFDNIVLVPNLRNYLFDVDCKCGRQDQDRWRFVPEDKDVGSFPLSVKVFDDSSKLLAEASTTVHVSPRDAGKDKEVSVLHVGDSLTHAAVYPAQLLELCKADGNPRITLVGHAPNEKAPSVRIEGYGGWTAQRFMTYFKEEKRPEGQVDWRTWNAFSSPFLYADGQGKFKMDFSRYCAELNNGKAPDFITIFLGTNDVYGANDSNIDKIIDDVFTYFDAMIAEFRSAGSQTKIGLALVQPPAGTQDAFGENGACGQTRWQYRKNQHRLVERLLQKYAGREQENICVIPLYVNMDCANNYPKKEEQVNARNPKKVIRDCNAVHPASEGYYQIADSFYSWLKYELGNK